jgi:hypothetical protein
LYLTTVEIAKFLAKWNYRFGVFRLALVGVGIEPIDDAVNMSYQTGMVENSSLRLQEVATGGRQRLKEVRYRTVNIGASF